VRDPYLLLLWEQVAYLASDAERLAAYRLLEQRVGTAPTAILGASMAALRAVARRGGAIAVAARAGRLRTVARRVLEVWDGNLRPVLRLPLGAARRELARYPAVGPPGAERILLLCGSHPVLGLDSNALRVLLRLGLGKEHTQWAKTYRVVQLAAERELPATVAARRSAYLLLRLHGQTLCRRSAPRCDECPLQSDCPTGRATVVKEVRRPVRGD
jgi:endonuclease III